MLIETLTDHFQSYFTQADHYDVVLWFDPDQEYAALLDHLTDLSLWRYENSLLQIRYRLIHRAPGERAVVYLPLHRRDAEVPGSDQPGGFILTAARRNLKSMVDSDVEKTG
jgi:hypothetical protein